MRQDIFNYLSIAAQTATSKDDERSFLLGCVGIRKDGVMVRSLNGPSQHPDRKAHAEFRCAKKVDKGAVLYVARIRICDGQLGMARPCKNCLKMMISRKVRLVYYSIGPNEFGRIDVEKLTETTHRRKER